MTRTRDCHGESGFCGNDDGDPCNNANLDNTYIAKSFVKIGKKECARCDMVSGKCCVSMFSKISFAG